MPEIKEFMNQFYDTDFGLLTPTSELEKVFDEKLENENIRLKKITETAKESKKSFSKIFSEANDGIVYLSKYGKILEANKKAMQIFGGSSNRLIPMS